MDVKSVFPGINWIASYPKSGNTWVRCLVYAYTFGHLDINAIGQIIGSDLNLGAWYATAPLPWSDLNVQERLMCRYTALMIIMSTCGQPKCMLKTHCGNFNIDEVAMIPSAFSKSSVYLVRDPRDVAISYSHHIGKNIDETIDYMNMPNMCLDHKDSGVIQAVGSWSNNVQSWLEETKFEKIVVKYEDLKMDTATEFKKILEVLFPDVEIDYERVQNAVSLCEFDKLKTQEKEKGFIESTDHGEFFHAGKSRWRNILTSEQIQKIQNNHGEAMELVGYELV